jgi:hypothetical protein
MRLHSPVRLRPHDRVDLETVMRRELLEIALTVRDQPDPDVVAPELGEHG